MEGISTVPPTVKKQKPPSMKVSDLIEVFVCIMLGFVVMWGFQLFKDLRSANLHTPLHLLGTTNLTAIKPYKLADAMIEEATFIWNQPSGTEWLSEINNTALLVESKPVLIDGKKVNLPLQRAVAMTNCTSAKDLFDFMMSPEGFEVIDPISNPQDFYAAPISSYSWGRRGTLKIDRTIVPLVFPLTRREFVVLNVKETKTMTFVSKSVIYPTSKKFPVVRAFNSFALKISNTKTKHMCKMELINIVTGLIPYDGLANFINAKLYFPQMMNRLKKALKTSTTIPRKK